MHSLAAHPREAIVLVILGMLVIGAIAVLIMGLIDRFRE